MRRLSCLFISSFFLLFAGCAVTAIGEENRQRETRIDAKMQELASQQSKQRVLVDEQSNLLQEQGEKQRVLNELDAKLASLIKENAQAEARSNAQRKKKEEIESRLRKYREEISELKSDPRSPDEEKKRQIEELEKRIDAYLKSLRAL